MWKCFAREFYLFDATGLQCIQASAIDDSAKIVASTSGVVANVDC